MNSRTNESVRIRIKLPEGCGDELVKKLDLAAKARGISRSEMIESILAEAARRSFSCVKGATSPRKKVANTVAAKERRKRKGK